MLCSGKEMKRAGIEEAAEIGRASQNIMSEASRLIEGWGGRRILFPKSRQENQGSWKIGWRCKLKEKQESTVSLEPCERELKVCMHRIPSGMSERASPTAKLPA